jgi:hypothetical protein
MFPVSLVASARARIRVEAVTNIKEAVYACIMHQRKMELPSQKNALRPSW